MTGDQKELIQMHVNLLRETMRKEGLVFGIVVNRNDYDKSSIAIMDRDSAQEGSYKGISISLKDLNRGLV